MVILGRDLSTAKKAERLKCGVPAEPILARALRAQGKEVVCWSELGSGEGAPMIEVAGKRVIQPDLTFYVESTWGEVKCKQQWPKNCRRFKETGFSLYQWGHYRHLLEQGQEVLFYFIHEVEPPLGVFVVSGLWLLKAPGLLREWDGRNEKTGEPVPRGDDGEQGPILFVQENALTRVMSLENLYSFK